MTFGGWSDVAERLRNRASQLQVAADQGRDARLNAGQRAMLMAIADRIPDHGLVIADEVGMGKTRIAVELSRCVIEAGGRVVIVVPPGLGFQWRDELHDGEVAVPPILRGIDGYFAAWADEGNVQEWAQQRALIISHAFANWSLKGNVRPWRWALLPEVYANWRQLRTGRFPREYHDNDYLLDARVAKAAKSITARVWGDKAPGGDKMAEMLDSLVGTLGWKDCLIPEGYTKGDGRRAHLEKVIGLGLGGFDLVIVDEAHKSRGDGSVLSAMLGNVLLKRTDARIVGMTATPVEIDSSQWRQSLERIGIEGPSLVDVARSVACYSEAIRRVRSTWRSNPDARREFADAATDFNRVLSPFVLRRDKREDAAVRLFQKASGRPINQYRDETREIVVDPAKLSIEWRRAVCAAESMSMVARAVDGSKMKRLRLTMGSGHGISSCIDRLSIDPTEDSRQEAQDRADDDDAGSSPAADHISESDEKRTARLGWWTKHTKAAVGPGDAALFKHPAILAAMRAIESSTEAGEKVLVFGRFTAPMVALVGLLNARELLRRLAKDEPWRQAGVAGDERKAVTAAWEMWRDEHHADHPVQLDAIDAKLEERYEVYQRSREKTRQSLRDCLLGGDVIGQGSASVVAGDVRCAALATAMRQSDDKQLTVVTRALEETIGDDAGRADSETIWRAFRELMNGVVDRDEGDYNGDGTLDEDEAGDLWETVVKRVVEEFPPRPQGGFARLMNGGTKPSTRRLLQQAFNRQQSFPRVLVAQSLVGREGLNLHKACRIVVMLHLEWNPGVVEQQIGRVDRVQSHWAKQLEAALKDGVAADKLPRIEVRPVIFSGTYDEHNWTVLRERWDDLRAQLHGVVISERVAGQERRVDEAAALKEVLDAAPSFSPTVREL